MKSQSNKHQYITLHVFHCHRNKDWFFLFLVPCTVTIQQQEQTSDYNATVLAEFSSVVADTQQYIMSDNIEPQVCNGHEYRISLLAASNQQYINAEKIEP